ncbi:MAG: hypothetical protein R2728_10215 [Chitinophagales bacterium]
MKILKFPPFKSEYGAYSAKAIKKLLPLMRRGKYWKEENISNEVKERIASIIVRLESINYDKSQIDEFVADDDIPKQLLKSFLEFKGKNPLKGLNTYQKHAMPYITDILKLAIYPIGRVRKI